MRGLSLVAASGGHSSSRCAGLSLSRPLLLRSTGSRRAGSVIVAHGPSCSAACGIFPDQGSNPCPLHWQADSQPLRHQGSPTFCSNENPRLSQDVTSLADLTSSSWFPSLITGPGGGVGALPPAHCHVQTVVPAFFLKYWSLEACIIPLSCLHLQTSLGNSPLEKIRG